MVISIELLVERRLLIVCSLTPGGRQQQQQQQIPSFLVCPLALKVGKGR
jgi:hypothetical protein